MDIAGSMSRKPVITASRKICSFRVRCAGRCESSPRMKAAQGKAPVLDEVHDLAVKDRNIESSRNFHVRRARCQHACSGREPSVAGANGDAKIIGGIQGCEILVNNKEHDNLEAGLHGLILKSTWRKISKKVFKLGSGKINHIIAAKGAHDRVKQFHLALDLDEIDKGGAPRKGGAKRPFREICVDDEGVAVVKQQDNRPARAPAGFCRCGAGRNRRCRSLVLSANVQPFFLVLGDELRLRQTASGEKVMDQLHMGELLHQFPSSTCAHSHAARRSIFQVSHRASGFR